MDVEEYRAMYVAEKTNWWFVGRNELLSILFKTIFGNIIKARNNINVLDVGCGTGSRLEEIKKYGNVIGIDISKEALGYAQSKVSQNLICGDAQLLPIKAESLDVILLLDVLEHLEHDDIAVKEAYRVLRQDGFLIVTVPTFKILWSRHDEWLHHKRRYNMSEVIYMLGENNFTIKRITYWNMAMFFPALLMMPFRNAIESISISKNRRYQLPDLMNSILLQMLRIENKKITIGKNLPVGISIVYMGKKS